MFLFTSTLYRVSYKCLLRIGLICLVSDLIALAQRLASVVVQLTKMKMKMKMILRRIRCATPPTPLAMAAAPDRMHLASIQKLYAKCA